jgi:hypothetical protein
MIRRKLLYVPTAGRVHRDGPPYIGSALCTRTVSYWCLNGHHTPRAWFATAPVPPLWDCRHCGLPAGQDKNHPPEPLPLRRLKTPLTHLRERRSEAELEVLLNEALDRLHAYRLIGRTQGTCDEPGRCRA